MPKRQTSITRPSRQRSAVTNGRRTFVEGDGTSAWARRYVDLVELHAHDLGPAESLSEAQFSLIRRAVTLEIELEAMEGKLSSGIAVDLDLYNRMTGTLGRTLERLGMHRVARDVGPTDIHAYAAQKRREREAATA